SLAQWRGTPRGAFQDVLRSEGCEALIVQEYEHARYDALAVLAARMGLPLHATFQGGDVTLSRLEACVRRWTVARSRSLIVASGRERERVAGRYGAAGLRIANIPNPLDVDEWRSVPRAEARAALGLPPDAFVVMTHGRIEMHRKGLDVLLEAWRRFSADRAGAR